MTWHISYTIHKTCVTGVWVLAVEVFDGFFEWFYASIIRADFDFITKFHFNLVTWHRQRQQQQQKNGTIHHHWTHLEQRVGLNDFYHALFIYATHTHSSTDFILNLMLLRYSHINRLLPYLRKFRLTFQVCVCSSVIW